MKVKICGDKWTKLRDLEQNPRSPEICITRLAIHALKQFFKTDCFAFTNVSEQKSFYSRLITVPDSSGCDHISGWGHIFPKNGVIKLQTQRCSLTPLCFINHVLLVFFFFSLSLFLIFQEINPHSALLLSNFPQVEMHIWIPALQLEPTAVCYCLHCFRPHLGFVLSVLFIKINIEVSIQHLREAHSFWKVLSTNYYRSSKKKHWGHNVGHWGCGKKCFHNIRSLESPSFPGKPL